MFFAVSQKSQVGQSLRNNWLDDAPSSLSTPYWCSWNHAPQILPAFKFSLLDPSLLLIAQSNLNSFETQRTVAYQAPLSIGFSRQEYWSWVAISFSKESS